MAKKFLDPHEVKPILGTEGWEEMYPFYYQFSKTDKERMEYESSQLWFYDGLHYPEPHYPFDLIWDEAWYLALSQYNTRVFMVPPAKGIDHRIVNGYVYITPVGITDPKEIESRIPLFQKRAGYYYENWDKIYDKWVDKTKELIAELENISFPDLPEIEDESIVFDSSGLSSGYNLGIKYDELINMGFKVWQYHFEMLNLGYAAYVTFINTANEVFPDIPMHNLTKMVSGIDTVMYRPDEELIKLAKLAITLGIDPVIASQKKFDTLAEELKKSDKGISWLDALERARYPWFYISTGTGWYHHHISWNDNLDIPLSSINMYIEVIKDGKNPSRSTEKLIKERDETVEKYINLIKNEDQRNAFEETLKIARRVFPYVENHMFYVENWFHSVFWRKVRELAKIFVNNKIIDDVEDVWYLNRFEVKSLIDDLVRAWATGIIPAGRTYWPEKIKNRKVIIKKFQEWTPPPALGTPPEVVNEPFTIVLWGVTTGVLKNWLRSLEGTTSENITELQGSPGSAGIVEGKARVIRTVEQLDQLEKGEIMVAPTTSPSWAPVFTKIAGAVTDVGGPMCHAAIVCREYGLPTVVGTGNATAVIKTGDLIRINGNEGTVEIIEHR
ncbi:MAG: PEP-utilizing enzyme, mobile region [Epsilonproteobacteria bacterium]|nr:PEP-utilizing enzyme, mobile region [Campylobacterota bacterium]